MLYVRSVSDAHPATNRFLGVDLSDTSPEEAVREIACACRRGERCTVIPLNPHVATLAMRSPALRHALQTSFVMPDGIGVVMLARLFGLGRMRRVVGTDVMDLLTHHPLLHERGAFFLGGQHGTAKALEDILRSRDPEILINGVFEPPKVESAYDLPEDEMVEAANASGADVVFVALGAPKQEIFISRNRHRLKANCVMAVGASFDLLSGRKMRAPAWMRRAGLEWFFRLLQEPIRLGPRYLLGIPEFLWRALVLRQPIA